MPNLTNHIGRYELWKQRADREPWVRVVLNHLAQRPILQIELFVNSMTRHQKSHLIQAFTLW